MKKILLIVLLSSILNANIQSDKFAHAFVGVGIYGLCLVTGGVLDEMGYVHPLDTTNCLYPVFIAGAGKELYDANNEGHTSELNDFLATIIIPVAFSVTLYKW